MRLPGGRTTRLLAVLVLVALGAAACGSSSATSPSASSAPSSTSATSSTTTTTTTTLPRPVRVKGTGLTGAGAATGGTPGPTATFGAVERIPVEPLPAGASVPPPTTTSLPVPPGSVELAYRQVGSGPDLLLVAGEHASMSSWDPQVIQALSQHYTVVMFDLPSTGYSAPDPAVRSVEGLADVTAGLAYALGLTDTSVLGWGMGGQIALSLAERHPALVGRLVLVEATAGGPAATRPAAAVASLLADPSATPANLVGLELVSPQGRSALLTRMSAYAPDDLTTAAVRGEAAVEAASYADGSVAAGLAGIAAPALVVTGKLDEVVPPANSAVLMAHLRHARQLTVATAGYGVLSQDTAGVVGAIEAFTG